MADTSQPVAVIARLLDLSERRVQQLVRDGVIPKPERGRYDLIGAVRGYVRYLRDLVLKAEAGIADYGSERARLIKAKADLAEMEAAERRGALLPAAEVAAAWTEILALVRARVLALPDKLAPLTHETTTIAEARAVLRTGVRELLAEIAATEVAVADPVGPSGTGKNRAGGAEGGDAAAGADHQPVGGPQPEA